MKKSLSRILSLTLILAMLISVVPFTFAATRDTAAPYGATTETDTDPGDDDTDPGDDDTDPGDDDTDPGDDDTDPGDDDTDATVLVESITISGEKNTVEVKATLHLTAEVLPENATNREIVWSSSNTSVATVDQDGNVTGVKTGDVTITATAKDESGVSGEYAVKVVEGAVVVCKGISIGVDASDELEPEVPALDAATKISYKYTSKNTSIAIVGESSGRVTGRSVGVTTIHIVATYTENGEEKTAEGDVNVSVYSEPTLDVTVKSGVTSFTFGQDKVFSEVSYDGKVVSSLKDESLYNLLALDAGEWSRITFEESSAVTGSTQVGQLSAYSSTVVYLRNLKFTASGRGGDYILSYTIYNAEGLILAEGLLTITVEGYSGDIIYATDYSTAVTFDEDDFTDFWNENYSSSTNTLKYVEFDVSSSVPAYGSLYTTTSKNKSVTSSMDFYVSTSSAKTYYIDNVTYVPSTSKKTEYTVEIPFTAYGGSGTSSSTSLSGVVVIELNGTATGISSTGVIFGAGKNTIADQMAEDYENATDAELAYVIFDLPDVEDGRLYYDYTTILDTDYVTAKTEYYVKPGSKQLGLDDVAFVPAAGRSGNVTITYTGYDKNGKNAKEMKLVLNVVTKTKSSEFSDVTTSYSWAADSIDFLSYQGVVQGSNGKYNPSASITRGDFMIMLYRAFLEGEYGDYKVTSNFADVTKGTSSYSQETYQAVGVAKYLGIAQGDGTNFKPTTSITREEAMTLIYRTLDKIDVGLEYSTTTKASSFSDYSSVSSYAQSAITYLVQHGIVVGSNGKITPKSNITRAEMAVILHRVLTY